MITRKELVVGYIVSTVLTIIWPPLGVVCLVGCVWATFNRSGKEKA